MNYREYKWFKHIPRSLNTEADALVNLAQDQRSHAFNFALTLSKCIFPPVAIRVFWDGGVRARARGGVGGDLAACAWVLEVCFKSNAKLLSWHVGLGL